MLLDFKNFYKNYGVRQFNQLLQPRFGKLEHFQLPRGAIVHIAHGNPATYGPSENDVALQGFAAAIMKEGKPQPNGEKNLKVVQKPIARPILMRHISAMAPGTLGQTTKLQMQPVLVARQYHQSHRRFRQAMDMDVALKDENSLLVVNYGMLPHSVRYARNAFNAYYEWYNIEHTVWAEIAQLVEKSNRQHFIVCRTPTALPARSLLQNYERMNPNSPSQGMLKGFGNQERLFLGELWKWVGPARAKSLLSLIPRQKLGFVNLVFIESGHWTTVNLGTLDSWRQPQEDELQPNEVAQPNQVTPDKYQSWMLRFFMSMMHLRTTAPLEVVDLDERQVLDKDDADELRKELKSDKSTDPRLKEIESSLKETVDLGPDDTAFTVKVDDSMTAKIDAEISELEKMDEAKNDVNENGVVDDFEKRQQWAETPMAVDVPKPTLERLSHDEALITIAKKHLNSGSMSAAQYRNYEKLAVGYKNMQAPDSTQTLEQFIDIPPEVLKIESSKQIVDIETVPDKTMLKSSLLDFDKKYIEEVMQRDVASMVMCFAQAGYAVTDYNVETNNNLMGSYRMYTVRITPTNGTPSTIHFKLPVVDPDGKYTANGVRYCLRKQRTEIPICKVAPDTVALTSYYGKSFVQRSEKKINNYGTWLRNNIMSILLDDENKTITNGHPRDVSDNLLKAPRLYTTIAAGFSNFDLTLQTYPRNVGQLTFNMSFDHTKREELFGKDVLAKYEVDGAIVAGRSITGTHYFIIKKDSSIWVAGPSHAMPGYEPAEGMFSLISFEAIAGIDRSKAPVDIAVMKVSDAVIPVGVMLAYEIGLEPLLALLGSKIRRVPAGARMMSSPHEKGIAFNDETIYFSKDDVLTGLILGGFNEYREHVRRFNVHLFNQKEVYFNVLEASGLGPRYFREMDLLYQLFIDPITHDLLREMNEPTDMRRLLIRAVEMLVTDDHPDEQDGAILRLRGNERMAGAVYAEMVRSIRQHNSNAAKSRTPLSMDPFAVFTNIQTDSSKSLVKEINPIQDLKEQESVTYNGTGGRNSRTMTKKTRSYHRNDMGVISSDTVDSSDVAINTYTSADPQLVSLRGLSRRYDESMGSTALLSTSALMAPGSDRDDAKRVNFVGIQNTHTVSCLGYHQLPVRTGYEQVIAHRVGDLFAATASQDGKVISVTDTGVIVQYADGSKQGYEIGRRFGRSEGLVIPHSIVSNVKVGDVLKPGDAIIYNTDFFEPDILNPKSLAYKGGILMKTAFMEIPETLEDSSAVSERVAERYRTRVSKAIDISVSFEQEVHKLVKVGQDVDSEDILCIIEDAVSSQANLFDKESLDTLKVLSNAAPQAKVKGRVERVEVYYHGDKEDMSDTLRAIADMADKDLMSRLKSAGKQVMTGSVDEAFRVEGDPLQLDNLCIRIYITTEVGMGEGDKHVISNQMKSVVGKKLTSEYRTESGEVIDVIYGTQSIDNRVVESPILIGMYNVLLDLIGQEAVAAYES